MRRNTAVAEEQAGDGDGVMDGNARAYQNHYHHYTVNRGNEAPHARTCYDAHIEEDIIHLRTTRDRRGE